MDVLNGDMNLAQLRAELARFTYKPNVQLRIDGTGEGWAVLRIIVNTKNTYRPTEGIEVIHSTPLPSIIANPDHFADFLRHCIKAFETHEADEWLRRDGDMLFDPHADREPYVPVRNLGPMPGRRT